VADLLAEGDYVGLGLWWHGRFWLLIPLTARLLYPWHSFILLVHENILHAPDLHGYEVISPFEEGFVIHWVRIEHTWEFFSQFVDLSKRPADFYRQLLVLLSFLEDLFGEIGHGFCQVHKDLQPLEHTLVILLGVGIQPINKRLWMLFWLDKRGNQIVYEIREGRNVIGVLCLWLGFCCGEEAFVVCLGVDKVMLDHVLFGGLNYRLKAGGKLLVLGLGFGGGYMIGVVWYW